MPMKWDAAAESKLLTAIVRIYDVRLGGDKSERLAKLMGPGEYHIAHSRTVSSRTTAEYGHRVQRQSDRRPHDEHPQEGIGVE